MPASTLQNEPRVRGKDRIDLRLDPPPDVVVEIDITNSSLPRQQIYASLGVTEVWRYDGETLTILLLHGKEYVASPESRALPNVTATALSDVLAKGKGMEWKVWLRQVQEWTRRFSGQ